MLNCIYQYGGHVICPNEWTNCSGNEGLWIPGDDLPAGVESTVNDPNCTAPGLCCSEHNATTGNCTSCKRCHGNPQFQAALRDFVALAQDYERGTCPSLRVNKLTVWYYDNYSTSLRYFTRDDGLYIMVGSWLICIIFMIIALSIISANTRQKKQPTKRDIERQKKAEKERQIENDRIERLKKLLRVSEKLRISQMAELLEIDTKDLRKRILDWADQFGFTIDEDIVKFESSRKDAFIDALSDAFADWNKKTDAKEGKLE